MSDYFTYGGSLPEEAPSYVTREADNKLYQNLKKGNYCCVFNSRQTGKSSLKVKTIGKLTDENIVCANLDFSLEETYNISPDRWYSSMMDAIVGNFILDFDFDRWLEANKNISNIRRFIKLIEDVILSQIKQKIVIFIDEIDSVLSLNFPTDDLFACIRGFYNNRATNPEYERLTFCLLGVTTPSDLIRDKRRTPYNIGHSIELCGFTYNEAKDVLLPGLKGKVVNPEMVLREIIEEWTGGQPFLTQKLCYLVVQNAKNENANLKSIVNNNIVNNWEANDDPEHLRTIKNRLREYSKSTSRLLYRYEEILKSREVYVSNNPEEIQLRLSGIVKKNQQGNLRVCNRIYESVFSQRWVYEMLEEFRPYAEELKSWIASSRQDDSRLLQGKALEEAWSWSGGKNLDYRDYQFLTSSLLFDQKDFLGEKDQEKLEYVQEVIITLYENKKLPETFNNSLFVAKRIIYWTGGNLELTKLFSQIIQDELNECNLVFDTDEFKSDWIHKKVVSKIIDNWDTEFNLKCFKKIKTTLLERNDSFNLLRSYQKFLNSSTLDFNAEAKVNLNPLIECQLLIVQNNYIKTYNYIFRFIFCEQWVEQNIVKLNPFSSSLSGWINSNKTNSSFLIKGNDLNDILSWANNKQLNETELIFLAACNQTKIDNWATYNESFSIEKANSSSSKVSWICTGIPEINDDNFSKNPHPPCKNYGDYCIECGLPRELALVNSSSKFFTSKLYSLSFWESPLFIIPFFASVICLILLLVPQFLDADLGLKFTFFVSRILSISLVWTSLLPVDRLLFQNIFKINMNTSAKISIVFALFSTSLIVFVSLKTLLNF